jgi:hypothetical protein
VCALKAYSGICASACGVTVQVLLPFFVSSNSSSPLPFSSRHVLGFLGVLTLVLKIKNCPKSKHVVSLSFPVVDQALHLHHGVADNFLHELVGVHLKVLKGWIRHFVTLK